MYNAWLCASFLIKGHFVRTRTNSVSEQAQPTALTPEEIVANTKVTITINAPGIKITAVTPRLILRSVDTSDVDFYQSMWGNPQVMATFDDGNIRLYKDKESEKRGTVNYAKYHLLDKEVGAAYLWHTGVPFQDYTIFDKRSGTKIGIICLEKIANQNCFDLELYSLLSPEVWNKGYGSEASITITHSILPAILLSKITDVKPTNVIATIRPDNTGSKKIAEKIGMKLSKVFLQNPSESDSQKYLLYDIKVQDLVKSYQEINLKQQHKGSSSSSKSKAVLPLFELRKGTGEYRRPTETVTIGGHSLRNVNKREYRV